MVRTTPEASSSTSTTVIVTVLVLVIVGIFTTILLLYWRRATHTRKLLAAVRDMAPAVPPNCRQQAEEAFDLRYADLLGNRAVCHQAFESRRVSPSEFVPTGVTLGQGMFSHVVLARFAAPRAHVGWIILGPQTARENVLVAVKELRTEQGHEAAVLTQVLLEARLLAVMDHPHIVRLVAMSDNHLPLRLALEYCAKGDLRRFLREGGGSRLRPRPDAGCLILACQIASAVQYLHSKLCIHRDLAARNVLLQAGAGATGADSCGERSPGSCGYVAKLADLGLARALRKDDDYYRVRSCVYMARAGKLLQLRVNDIEANFARCICSHTLFISFSPCFFSVSLSLLLPASRFLRISFSYLPLYSLLLFFFLPFLLL